MSGWGGCGLDMLGGLIGRSWSPGTLVVLALLFRGARCGLIDVLVGGSLGD
jgi:hypothetical protein